MKGAVVIRRDKIHLDFRAGNDMERKEKAGQENMLYEE